MTNAASFFCRLMMKERNLQSYELMRFFVCGVATLKLPSKLSCLQCTNEIGHLILMIVRRKGDSKEFSAGVFRNHELSIDLE